MEDSGDAAMIRLVRAPLDLLVWLLALVGVLVGCVVIAIGLALATVALNLIEVFAWLLGKGGGDIEA
jgi:hypothetical protein